MAASMQRSVVDNFGTLTTQLISEAAAYAASTDPDPETEGNIRLLRTYSTALNAALQSVQFIPRAPTPPAPPEVVPATAHGAPGATAPSPPAPPAAPSTEAHPAARDRHR